MPRAQCTACHDHPAALPAAICRACVAQLGRDLVALPDWHRTLLEPPRNGVGRRPRGADLPAPLSDRAGGIRHEIKATLVSWVRLVHDENPDATWPDDDVPAIAWWLTEHESWLLAHEAAGEYALEIGRLTQRAERAAAPRRDLVPIGTHPGTDDQPCGGRVLADPVTRDAWCTTCGERGDITWWRGRLPVAAEYMTMPQLVTHLAIAHELQVTAGLIRLWAFRSKVRSQRQGKLATYNVHDAIKHATEAKKEQEAKRVIAGQADDPVRCETRTASLASPEIAAIG